MTAARRGVGLLAFVAIVTAAGCGSEGTGPGDTFTPEELQLAVSAIFDRSVVRAQQILPPRLPSEAIDGPTSAGSTVVTGGPMAVLVPVEADTLDPAVPCAVSGTVEILAEYQGSVDDQNGNFDVNYRVELDHQTCVEGAGGDQASIGLDGRPGVVARFDAFSLDEGLEAVSGEILGTLQVTTENGPVICTLEMNFTGEGAEGQISYSFLGRLCGDAFQATFQSGI